MSPTHAHELRTPFGGFGLHDTFIGLRDRFVGIVNGIDQRVWDPATDKQITTHYTPDTLEREEEVQGVAAAACSGSSSGRTSRSSR